MNSKQTKNSRNPITEGKIGREMLIFFFPILLGSLFQQIYNTGSGILRAVGDSRRPFGFLVVTCVLNIILDLLFILVFGMGVFGAALATILSQGVSAILVLIVMMRPGTVYQLELRKLRIDGPILKKVVRIGLPAGLQSIMYGSSNIIIQVGVNGLGTDYVAAWATYYKIDVVFWMTMSAFGIVGATFVGQNYGAGRKERVKRSIIVNLEQAFAAAIFLSFVIYLTGPYLFPLFSTDAQVNRIGVDMMRYLSRFYVLYVCIEIFSSVLRGVGDTLVPMLLCGIGVCLLRSAWILLVMPIHNNMYTVMFSYPLSWVVTSIAFIVSTLR